MLSTLLNDIYAGDHRAISRAISLIVNSPEYEVQLEEDFVKGPVPVVGITGPPGAGKSTLTDKLLGEIVRSGMRVAVICVDPSSPFTKGAILGDRIRMPEWHNNPSVYIRSLATRGSLGGLPEAAGKVIQLLKAAPFDLIIVETVGVGQNEVQIASLADCTLVVLVPESGDEIQFMKAGLMEIADIFVINKCDRPGADQFANDIRAMLYGTKKKVVKTIATGNHGIGELFSAIRHCTGWQDDDEAE